MIYTFENCSIDTDLRTLQHAGQTIRLRPKALQVCLYLLEHRDRAVSKDELIEQVWPDQFISEATLTSTVREVRRAVGDSGRAQRVIQALHGHGYRFIAAVEASSTTPKPHPTHDSAYDLDASAAARPTAEPSPLQAQRVSDDLRASAQRPCPACQHHNRATARFCESCGQRLDESAPVADQRIGYAPIPLMGREQELAVLKAWLKHAEQGQGHAVGLVGAPGIGRSRLLAAFCEDLREQSIELLEVRCQPYGQQVPFFPVRDLTRQYCQIAETDAIETMTAKVAHHPQAADLLSGERADDIRYLLGIPEAKDRPARLRPAMVRVRIQATLRQIFLTPLRRQPLVLVIHDLHWIDATSAMWLSSLVEHLADTATLILTTYHEGYQPPWIASPTATELSLQPLSPQLSLQVVHAMRPLAQLPDALAQFIIAQANVNPLSLEVLTRLVSEPGPAPPGLTRALSLQEAMTRWFNRLAEPAKRLLQTAAVLGQESAVSLLRILCEDADHLESQIAAVESQGFCTMQTDSDEHRFRFAHRLIQEVVYASLDASERRDLHAAAVRALEAQGGANLTAAPLLAWHASHSQRAATAIRHLTHLAEQAVGLFAHAEAIQCIQEAQTLVPSLPAEQQPPCRLELLLRHAQSLLAMQRWQEAQDLLSTLQPELSGLPDASMAARQALLLSQASSGLGAWEQALQHAQHAVETATEGRDDATIEQAYAVLATASYGAGRPLQGIEHSRQALARLRLPDVSSHHAKAHIVLGLNALLLGDITTALEAASDAETMAIALEEPPLQTYAAWLLGWIHATRGASNEGIAACQRSLDAAVAPLNTAFALGWLGYAYLEHGDAAVAIPKLEQAVQQMRQWHYPRMAGLYTVFVAEALLAQAQYDAAHERAQGALAQCQASAYAFGIGWAQRTLGRLVLATENLSASRQHLADALATFAAMPARFEMGRTHLDLAAANAQDHRDTAARHLTEAHRWFESLHVQTYVEHATRLACDIGLDRLSGVAH